MAREPLNIEQPASLIAYLRATRRIEDGETPQVRVLSGGVSNRVVWLERATGEAWVLKQALDKLRVQADWFSSPARNHCEALAIRYLAELTPPGTIPRLIFEDPEQHLLAMEAVPQPHENWKSLLLAGRIDRPFIEAFGHLLGSLHRQAYERRAELGQIFADRSFFETLRLEPYYAYAATRTPEAASFLHQLIQDTTRSILTLVHGDYSPKNILIHRGRLVLLDHEVIHFGDGAFDLGFSLTHLLSKAHHLPEARDALARAAMAYWKTYATHLADLGWGPEFEARCVRHTLACLLARVDGRSPLEYLTGSERIRQRQAVLTLIPSAPKTVPEAINHFIATLA